MAKRTDWTGLGDLTNEDPANWTNGVPSDGDTVFVEDGSIGSPSAGPVASVTFAQFYLALPAGDNYANVVMAEDGVFRLDGSNGATFGGTITALDILALQNSATFNPAAPFAVATTVNVLSGSNLGAGVTAAPGCITTIDDSTFNSFTASSGVTIQNGATDGDSMSSLGDGLRVSTVGGITSSFGDGAIFNSAGFQNAIGGNDATFTDAFNSAASCVLGSRATLDGTSFGSITVGDDALVQGNYADNDGASTFGNRLSVVGNGVGGFYCNRGDNTVFTDVSNTGGTGGNNETFDGSDHSQTTGNNPRYINGATNNGSFGSDAIFDSGSTMESGAAGANPVFKPTSNITCGDFSGSGTIFWQSAGTFDASEGNELTLPAVIDSTVNLNIGAVNDTDLSTDLLIKLPAGKKFSAPGMGNWALNGHGVEVDSAPALSTSAHW